MHDLLTGKVRVTIDQTEATGRANADMGGAILDGFQISTDFAVINLPEGGFPVSVELGWFAKCWQAISLRSRSIDDFDAGGVWAYAEILGEDAQVGRIAVMTERYRSGI